MPAVCQCIPCSVSVPCPCINQSVSHELTPHEWHSHCVDSTGSVMGTICLRSKFRRSEYELLVPIVCIIFYQQRKRYKMLGQQLGHIQPWWNLKSGTEV